MLIHACGTIDYKMLLVTDITLATPSPGIKVVLNQPQASWSTSLSDLVQQTLEITKESDHLSIRSKYVSIKMIGKTIAGHLPQGNFTTNRVTTLNNKDRNTCMVEQECLKDMISKTKNSMDVLDAHEEIRPRAYQYGEC